MKSKRWTWAITRSALTATTDEDFEELSKAYSPNIIGQKWYKDNKEVWPSPNQIFDGIKKEASYQLRLSILKPPQKSDQLEQAQTNILKTWSDFFETANEAL